MPCLRGDGCQGINKTESFLCQLHGQNVNVSVNTTAKYNSPKQSLKLIMRLIVRFSRRPYQHADHSDSLKTVFCGRDIAPRKLKSFCIKSSLNRFSDGFAVPSEGHTHVTRSRLMLKGIFFVLWSLWHGNLLQLTTHSPKPKASDSDLAVSSVTMSKSNIVRGPTLSQEILCERRRETERAGIPLCP